MVAFASVVLTMAVSYSSTFVVCNTLVTMSIIIIFITDVASAGMSSPLGPPLGRRSLGCRVSSSMGAPFRHHHHWSGVHGEVAGVPLSLGCLHVKRLITEFDLLAFWPTDTTDLGGPFVHISAPKCNYRIATSYLFRAHRRGHVSWCVSQDAFGSL